MKKNKKQLLAFFLIYIGCNIQCIAQGNSCPSGTQYVNCDCHPNGPFINTAPVAIPNPYISTSYQTNTWDWTQAHLNATNNNDYSGQSNTLSPPGLQSPFWQEGTAGYLAAIAGDANSDFYPADGWELIKRDFGTKYDGTSDNGYGSPAPYFILYNKYSGKLRVKNVKIISME